MRRFLLALLHTTCAWYLIEQLLRHIIASCHSLWSCIPFRGDDKILHALGNHGGGEASQHNRRPAPYEAHVCFEPLHAHAAVPAWLRYTSAEATEALLASAKLKPTEAAQLRAAEAQKQAAGAAAAVKAEPPGVAGPSKARRKSRPTVSFQVPSFLARHASAAGELVLLVRLRSLIV